MPLTGQPVAGTPEWWLLRLLQALQNRQPRLSLWNDYYDGVQPLAFASAKFEEAFGSRFPAFTSNFCGLVVDGTTERLEVQGFRFADDAGDKDVWDIWQANDLDAGSQLAHTEALIKGCSYALVEPSEPFPVITIEDATSAIVEHGPKSRRDRRAGLKRWVDDDGMLVVYLYLPDFIYKYRTGMPWGDQLSGWWGAPRPWDAGHEWGLWNAGKFEPLQVADEEWPLPNRLGVVPLIELPNRPRLVGPQRYGQSEIAAIRSNQDAVNKYRCDALIASEFAAFPQRYLLNFEPEVDPDTGRKIEPFRAAIDRLWTIPPPDPDDPNPQPVAVGQFAAASLEPYTTMINLEVAHISAISRMPKHALLADPQSLPPSGESIKSSEAGLIRKVGRIELHLGEGWEETMRVALLARQDARSRQNNAETIWVDAETRNEAVRTDSIVKLHAAGIIDDELSWEMAGLSPEQIRRMQDRRAAASDTTLDEATLATAVDAAAVLIRSGFEPQDALRAVGLDPIRHLGLLPITVKDSPQLTSTSAGGPTPAAILPAPTQPATVAPAPTGPRMGT